MRLQLPRRSLLGMRPTLPRAQLRRCAHGGVVLALQRASRLSVRVERLSHAMRAPQPKCALHGTRRRLLRCGGVWRFLRVQRRRLLCVSGVLR